MASLQGPSLRVRSGQLHAGCCILVDNSCPPSPPAEPVFASVDEKLSCILSKQGGVESLEVQGTLSLVVATDADAFIRCKVNRISAYLESVT